jgi:hypothetical protein
MGPFCVGAAIGIFGLLRAIGISDVISALYIGGLAAAVTLWLNRILIDRYGRWYKYQGPLFLIFTLSLVHLCLTLLGI